MADQSRVARSVRAAIRIARAIKDPAGIKFYPSFSTAKLEDAPCAVLRSHIPIQARRALGMSLFREILVCGYSEEPVWPPIPPYAPNAFYDEGMDILTIRTRDCSTVSKMAGDPDRYFDLLYAVSEKGKWGRKIVGIQIWGFSGLVRQPRAMHDKLMRARKRRLERSKQQKQPVPPRAE